MIARLAIYLILISLRAESRSTCSLIREYVRLFAQCWKIAGKLRIPLAKFAF